MKHKFLDLCSNSIEQDVLQETAPSESTEPAQHLAKTKRQHLINIQLT